MVRPVRSHVKEKAAELQKNVDRDGIGMSAAQLRANEHV